MALQPLFIRGWKQLSAYLEISNFAAEFKTLNYVQQ